MRIHICICLFMYIQASFASEKSFDPENLEQYEGKRNGWSATQRPSMRSSSPALSSQASYDPDRFSILFFESCFIWH